MSRSNTFTRGLRQALLVGAGVLTLVCAHAAPTVYFGIDNALRTSAGPNALAARDAFVTAAGAATITTQDYESAALGELAAVTTGVLANGVGVTLTRSTSGTDQRMRITRGPGTFNTHPAAGLRYLELLSEPGSTFFTATFDQALDGLGFFVSDVSDWFGFTPPVDDLFVVLGTASGATVELDLTPGLDPTELRDGNMAFFGVIDSADPFRSIAIRSGRVASGGDALGIDNFMVSLNRVPLPGTLALVLAGLAVLARRRSSGV